MILQDNFHILRPKAVTSDDPSINRFPASRGHSPARSIYPLKYYHVQRSQQKKKKTLYKSEKARSYPHFALTSEPARARNVRDRAYIRPMMTHNGRGRRRRSLVPKDKEHMAQHGLDGSSGWNLGTTATSGGYMRLDLNLHVNHMFPQALLGQRRRTVVV